MADIAIYAVIGLASFFGSVFGVYLSNRFGR